MIVFLLLLAPVTFTPSTKLMAIKRLVNFRGQCSTPACQQLVRSLTAEGFSQSAIAKKLHISRSSVSRVLSGREVKKRGGARPQSTAKKALKERWLTELKKIVNKKNVHGHPMYPSLKIISAKMKRMKLGPSGETTVRAGLNKLGFTAKKKVRSPKQWPTDKAVRMAFCRREVKRAGTLLFSDEKIFDTNYHGTRYQWCLGDTMADPIEISRWGATVHVWGCIGIGVKILVFFEKKVSVNSDRYLAKCITPHLTTLQQGVFQQDGAKAHTSKKCMKYFADNNIDVLNPWPPRSPDLNVIELLWATLSRNVSLRCPKSVPDLQKMVQEEWDKIPQAHIDKLVTDEYRRRVRMCLDVEGRILTRSDSRNAKKLNY